MSKKVDVKQELVDLAGEPLKQSARDGKGDESLTLGSVIVNALLHPDNEDDKTSGETKLARFNLAQKVFAADGPIEIANSDIAMIKKLVNHVFTSLIVGQVYTILDQKDEETEGTGKE